MPANEPEERARQDRLDTVGKLGDTLYEKLRGHLEEERSGEYIAIHVDSGEYEIGRTSNLAVRALLARRPADGRIHVQRIGDQPDYALAARILTGELSAGRAK